MYTYEWNHYQNIWIHLLVFYTAFDMARYDYIDVINHMPDLFMITTQQAQCSIKQSAAKKQSWCTIDHNFISIIDHAL